MQTELKVTANLFMRMYNLMKDPSQVAVHVKMLDQDSKFDEFAMFRLNVVKVYGNIFAYITKRTEDDKEILYNGTITVDGKYETSNETSVHYFTGLMDAFIHTAELSTEEIYDMPYKERVLELNRDEPEEIWTADL